MLWKVNSTNALKPKKESMIYQWALEAKNFCFSWVWSVGISNAGSVEYEDSSTYVWFSFHLEYSFYFITFR